MYGARIRMRSMREKKEVNERSKDTIFDSLPTRRQSVPFESKSMVSVVRYV